MTEQKPSYGVVDPDGVEPGADHMAMTDEQAAELRDLCDRLGEEFDTSLNKEQAAERIRALKDEAAG